MLTYRHNAEDQNGHEAERRRFAAFETRIQGWLYARK